jgi:hypothetical protein
MGWTAISEQSGVPFAGGAANVYRRFVQRNGGERSSPSHVCRLGIARARLTRETSPAKVAKDGQQDNHDDYDPKPSRHVNLSSGAHRLYDDPIRICNVCGLHHKWERLALGQARATDAVATALEDADEVVDAYLKGVRSVTGTRRTGRRRGGCRGCRCGRR